MHPLGVQFLPLVDLYIIQCLEMQLIQGTSRCSTEMLRYTKYHYLTYIKEPSSRSFRASADQRQKWHDHHLYKVSRFLTILVIFNSFILVCIFKHLCPLFHKRHLSLAVLREEFTELRPTPKCSKWVTATCR